jgi:hypothetical protein
VNWAREVEKWTPQRTTTVVHGDGDDIDAFADVVIVNYEVLDRHVGWLSRRGFKGMVVGEVLATSDVPGGVVNILTGSPAEIAPWLASHADVNALDLTGAEALDWIDLEMAAADTLKRVTRPEPGVPARSLDRILSFVETKTVWHTKALI